MMLISSLQPKKDTFFDADLDLQEEKEVNENEEQKEN